MRRRRNPDERMRDLERQAALGDQEAEARLRAAQARSGSFAIEFPLVSFGDLETEISWRFRRLANIPDRPPLYADFPPPRGISWIPGARDGPSWFVPGEQSTLWLMGGGERSPGLEIHEHPWGYSLVPEPEVDQRLVEAALQARDRWVIPMVINSATRLEVRETPSGHVAERVDIPGAWGLGYLRRLRRAGVLPPGEAMGNPGEGERRRRPVVPRTYEPREALPAGALPAEEVARTQACAHCKKRFILDAAHGIKGGVMVVNVGPGQYEYYHGYPGGRGGSSRTCYSQAMGQYGIME